jgi:hypothetical protein
MYKILLTSILFFSLTFNFSFYYSFNMYKNPMIIIIMYKILWSSFYFFIRHKLFNMYKILLTTILFFSLTFNFSLYYSFNMIIMYKILCDHHQHVQKSKFLLHVNFLHGFYMSR